MSSKTDDEKMETENNGVKITAFRRFLSQFVAITVNNMLLFDMGLCDSFPAIIIPALTGIANEHNQHEQLSLAADEASWLGSSIHVCQPIGSVLSALITDSMGRKRGMMIVNIPLTIAWMMMYNANEIWHIFMANILLGLGSGLAKWPVLMYIGEVCEPSHRSIFVAYTSVCGTLGMLFVFVLNTLMPWRTVALICMFVPIVTLIALCFIPDSPQWHLSKNRTDEAEKALCWLRGWTTKESITKEFHALKRYSKRSRSCSVCIKRNQKCVHPLATLFDKFIELKRKQTLKPLLIVVALFVIGEFSGIAGMMPYIIQIFKAYGSPMDHNDAAIILHVVNNLAKISFLLLLRVTGKRPLYLIMLTGIFICSAVISGYGFICLPNGYNSFDHPKEIPMGNQIPFVGIILWSFCTYCGVNSWGMLSEVFPFKVRAMASGIAAAIGYMLSFISTKTYYNLETSLSMAGIALFNCIIVGIGIILMYNILPETKCRTQEDIELHFSDNSKNVTNRKIARLNSRQKDEMDVDYVWTTTSNLDIIMEIENKHIQIESQNGRDNRSVVDDV